MQRRSSCKITLKEKNELVLNEKILKKEEYKIEQFDTKTIG